jgi:hypothetical protein
MTAVPAAVAAATVAAAPRLGALYASVKDKYLLQFGVPEDLLPVVRSMNTDADMERAESAIPQEAYEVLFLPASNAPL